MENSNITFSNNALYEALIAAENVIANMPYPFCVFQ